MSEDQIACLSKRVMLNMLIQGAATHTFFTAHHLVKDEIDQVDSDLIRLYDQLVPCLFLNPWIGDLILVQGLPNWFWRRLRKPRHPLYGCRLLRLRGRGLAAASRRWTFARAKEKGAWRFLGGPAIQSQWLMCKTIFKENAARRRLTEIAVDAACMVWSFDPTRLEADLRVGSLAFGELQPPSGAREVFLRAIAAGYSGVVRDETAGEGRAKLKVVARASAWPLLVHELVKGVAELICLHGMINWDEVTYESVRNEADRLCYEVWMMQAGAELWRRLLDTRPKGQPLAECLMNLALLEPDRLESLMFAITDEPERARIMLGELSG